MITRLLASLIGNRTAWRLGRSLYMTARGDVANEIETNGERMVQRCVVNGWKRSSTPGEDLIVFDVGANVGDWSRELLDMVNGCPGGVPVELHLFEPVPATHKVLVGRISGRGSTAKLHFRKQALSSAEGIENMFVRGTTGTNSLHPDTTLNDASAISIAKTTVYRYCEEYAIATIQLMKCDTEGHDVEVIQGALPLFREGRIRVMQFEYNHRWVFSRHYLKDVFDAFEGLPYRVGKIRDGSVDLYSDWHPEMERFFEANYLVIHRDALGWFDIRDVVPDGFNTLVPAST